MNIKKIGLTALAASLVSVSAYAGELSVSGSASMTASGVSGTASDTATDFTMGNAITFAGSGELDNGLTVNVSYQLDEGDNAGASENNVWDNHWVSIGSDSMGTLRLDGHGGSSAQSALDTTAAGDIFDSFDGAAAVATGITGVAVDSTAPGNNSLKYTLPTIVDGLSLATSYKARTTGTEGEAQTAYGGTYTGIDGLTVSYGTGDIETGVHGTSGDVDTYSGSYAYGPVTVAYSNTDATYGTTTNNQETTSVGLSYTISDELSISYGQETIDTGATSGSMTDAEYTAISAAYTTGGMTISGAMKEGDNIDHSTATAADVEYFELGASFAF